MTQTQRLSPLPTHRIIDVTLDTQAFAPSSGVEVEMERHKAVSDLLNDNTFGLIGENEGPYYLSLSLIETRLSLQVHCLKTASLETVTIALQPFQLLIRDYALLCDSFYKTARAGQIHKLETIDAGRRSLHDEAAEQLMDSLKDKVIVDKSTSRRLFTLIYVLHMRHITTNHI